MAKSSISPAEAALARFSKKLNSEEQKAFKKLILFNPERIQVDVVPSGSFVIDSITGVGGWPRRRISELFGDESAGKTTLALCACAEVLKAGGKIVYMDFEQSMSTELARNIGVEFDNKNAFLFQPYTFSHAADIFNEFLESKEIDLIVVDTWDAVRPDNELKALLSNKEEKVGAHAKATSRIMRSLIRLLAPTQTAVLIINQVREKVDTSWGAKFNPEAKYFTPGGRAIRFYASVRINLNMRRQYKAVIKDSNTDDTTEDTKDKGGKKNKKEKEYIHNEVYAECKKNKVGVPWKHGLLVVTFGKGVNNEDSIISMAVDNKLIRANGNNTKFSYEDSPGNFNFVDFEGRDNLTLYCRQYPKLIEELKSRIQFQLANVTSAERLYESGEDEEDDDELNIDVKERPTDPDLNGINMEVQ